MTTTICPHCGARAELWRTPTGAIVLVVPRGAEPDDAPRDLQTSGDRVVSTREGDPRADRLTHASVCAANPLRGWR